MSHDVDLIKELLSVDGYLMQETIGSSSESRSTLVLAYAELKNAKINQQFANNSAKRYEFCTNSEIKEEENFSNDY